LDTSRDLKKKFPFLKDVYWGTDGIWSDGYFVSTVGINEEVIRDTSNSKEKKIRGKRSLYSAFRPTRYHGRKPVDVSQEITFFS
jgi:hypothetical protein